MSLNLDAFVSVPVSIELYAEFARRFPSGVSSVLEQVAQDFLDRTAEDFAAREPLAQGIYWEALFLPEGTQIRTKHYGEFKVAEVANGEIMWEEESYPSMSQLARAMRGDTSNNAWKVLEIKRPSDARWQSADFLRR
ncbi:MAG: hypothetical protein OEL20_11970 [Sulfuritalea sp.]|nr:hypothetical protein [Sulfuritalea sp.]